MEDTRNVIDYYKGWETEAIKADLETRRTPLINLCVNLSGDFNKSSVIRAGNAFTVKKTIIAGQKKWDKRGAVGTHHYENIEYWADPIKCISHYREDEDYWVIPIDNTPEFCPVSAYKVNFPINTIFVYGEEQAGLSKEIIKECTHRPVYIPQHGSTRSINVAQAAACMMMLYDMQYPRDNLLQ